MNPYLNYVDKINARIKSIFSAGSVGALVGLSICLIIGVTGISLGPVEMLAITGGLAFLGTVTGYIVF